ncbi:MAG TPA: Arc family DNA-binding protein [Xanthobacteraceae bacterium]|jgi:plasmid stability protein|nr:Arc family DNA-binding protein [Xanthobacteraceae bacterium]
MAQLIVRDLDDGIKRQLQRRARLHGRSMEEEVRDILRDAVKDEPRHRGGFGTEATKLFKGIGLEKPIPELRGFQLKPAKFD